MGFLHRSGVVPVFAIAVACGDLTPPSAATPTPSQPTPPVPTVSSLVITPDSTRLMLGDAYSFRALLVMSVGSRMPTDANFWSGDNTIVITKGYGHALAVGPGVVNVNARVGGLTATARVVVPAPKSIGMSDALAVEAFSMMEYHTSSGGHWFYAPRVRVRSAQGRSAKILLLTFLIPGLDPPARFGCGATLGSGVAQELNGEDWGEWTMSFGGGQHSTGTEATGTITFLDDAGTMATLALQGPIVKDTAPDTYGGYLGACYEAYGSG